MKLLTILLLISNLTLFAEKKIKVVPDSYCYWNTMFPKTPDGPYGNLGTWGRTKYLLHKLQINLDGSSLEDYTGSALDIEQKLAVDEIEKIVLMSYPTYIEEDQLASIPLEKKVLMIYEPPTVEPRSYEKKYLDQFSKVLTWDDDLVDGEKFIKWYYPVMFPMKPDIIPFHKRKFCCLIARNKRSTHPKELYSERRKSITFFERNHPKEFDLFGHGWERENLPSYRGSIGSKYETLKKYKFSICYENMKDVRGYITEKIFDCFHCGVVPIYYGASNVTDYIPKECFIDARDFNSYEELYAYLKRMKRNEHSRILSNIRMFLRTDKAKLFHDDHFIETFAKEVAGISLDTIRRVPRRP